jgi:hypothetical protein
MACVRIIAAGAMSLRGGALAVERGELDYR